MIKNIILLLVIVLAPISGCRFNAKKPTPLTPLRYYRYGGYNLKTIGRVVMLEMENLSTNQGLSNELTAALSKEIQSKQIFGLDTLYLNDPKWKSMDISSDFKFSLEELAAIREKFKADAVMVGKITHYRPYPANSIGLKLELFDCSTGQLLWAIDQVWDSTDLKTEARIKSFYSTEMRKAHDPLDWKIVMQSPRIYNKFVTHEISQTLE
jgi:hypothetical protein